MAVTAAAYVGAAIIAASAAFIGVVIGKEQKTTEFRQDWINAQRNDLALLIAIAENVQSKPHKKKAAAKLEFDEILNRVLLRENPEKLEWKYVILTLNRIRYYTFCYPIETNVSKESIRAIEISRELLKVEWNRVRTGEKWFRIAKWSLPPTVFIVGIALAYGEGFIKIG